MTSPRNAAPIALLLAALAGTGCLEPPIAEFVLRNHLDHAFDEEAVFFETSREWFGRPDLVLRGPDGRRVPHQWVDAEQSPDARPSIAFLATLPAYGEARYRLVPGSPERGGDLRVEEDGTGVRLVNGLTGLRLHRGEAAFDRGPVAGVRLRSGRWVGRGKLSAAVAPRAHEVRITAAGPVFAEAVVDYALEDGGAWHLRYRIFRGQPVIAVDEEFHGAAAASYAFDLGSGFEPNRTFRRGPFHGQGVYDESLASSPPDTVFTLEPWVRGWLGERRGNWVGFHRDGDTDLLVLGAVDPGRWVEPANERPAYAVAVRNPGPVLDFQLRGSRRSWMLAALDGRDVLGRDALPPLPQRWVNRFGDVALDRLRRHELEWPEPESDHPRLFMSAAELAAHRSAYRADPARSVRLARAEPRLAAADELIENFLATGDLSVGRRILELALVTLEGCVDLYAEQQEFPTQGSDLPRHYNCVAKAVNLADVALAPGLADPSQAIRLRAQLAYLGYTLAGPSVLDPARGFVANPNMTTMTRSTLGRIACAIPAHPRAREWAGLAIAQLELELSSWTGPNGGWLEAPHYAAVALEADIALALALRRSGFASVDLALDPRLREAVAWLAKILTPPDARLGGARALPAIGNTFTGERCCLPGWMARIWRERDPRFSRWMQWAWRAQGSFSAPGVGGEFPAAFGYRWLMLDDTLPDEAPAWGSEWFPGAGALLRAHFPGPRELYLHYIQGELHQHYDFDEGSIVLWGLGSPLSEDFGHFGRSPATEHSLVDDGSKRELGREGRVVGFAAGPTPGLDYLEGLRGDWRRQILLVKDADPEGPTYVVLRDRVDGGRPAAWRLWLAADDPPPLEANPLRVTGRGDVDLVVFFAAPVAPRPSSVALSRKPRAGGPAELSQRSLDVTLDPGDPLSVVLFPVPRDRPTPRFAARDGGRVIEIETPSGIDYVLLGDEVFRSESGDLGFEGRQGLVQVRPTGSRLTVVGPARLRWHDRELEHDGIDVKTQEPAPHAEGASAAPPRPAGQRS